MATASATQVRDAVEGYAVAVTEGRTLAGPMVRLACQRHLRDLSDGPARGLLWDPAAAQHALDFFSFLRLAEGEWAGKPFVLQPWQMFIVGSLFGWYNGPYRRFRTAYIEAGKGSGKTALLAGIGLYGLLADGEEAAQVFFAAVTRDQAGLPFRDAKLMVEASPFLTARLGVGVSNLSHLPSNSFLRPVSAEARSLDGKRVHMALVDELHEHPTDLVVNKLRAGTKGRTQPLVVEITNAGYDRQSVCWQHHEYSRAIVEDTVQNDTWFGYVCGLDERDDWRDPGVWVKANPNLGVSIPVSYLQEQVNEAIGMPAKQDIVRRLNFCVWTESSNRWIDADLWDAGAEPFDAEALVGRPCYGGLDLAQVSDLSALALLFPPQAPNERWKTLVYYWCPEDDITERSRRIPYAAWRDQGLIQTTPGNTTDYDYIEQAVIELAARYQLREIAFDRMFAGQLVTHLMGEGLTMVPFGQGFLSMSPAVAQFERLLKGGQLQHGGNPILRWNAANVVMQSDAAGNAKPDKANSAEKIDGVVALIMATGRAMVSDGNSGPSVYETRGVLGV